MRWNCPHCGATLAVSDHRVRSEWMFANCRECGGYSMVRPRARSKPRVIYAGSAKARARNPPEPRVIAQAAPIPAPLPAKPDGSKWKRNALAAAFTIVTASAVIAGAIPSREKKSADPIVIQALEPIDFSEETLGKPEDTIHQRAMAPDRTSPSEALHVRISVEDANLRAGPGLDHPVLGLGDPTIRYRITQWQGRWFEIVPEEHASLGVNAPAWIRNDLLDADSGIAAPDVDALGR